MSPQMMGVAPVRDGIGNFQAMPSVALHFTGRPVSALTPFSVGPRHCGQLASTGAAAMRVNRNKAITSLRISSFL